jgi:hypothetical protein
VARPVNPYCRALGIDVPRLELAASSRDANVYALLIVALLERGEPITLDEAAARFETAGIAPAAEALASLKRCRPARPPIYRDGDRYALDPHDDEADLWAFRLGLKAPAAPPLRLVRPDPGPLPDPGEPLSLAHLEEAWREGVPGGWSALRVAICVLDAHGKAMRPNDVLAFVGARSQWSLLRADSAAYWRRGAAVRVRNDGLWELDREHQAVRSTRQAVRERVALVRRWAVLRPDPAVMAAQEKRYEQKREANAQRFAHMRRVVIHAFSAAAPRAVTLVDVERRTITTLLGDEIAGAGRRLLDYDILAAVDVRPLLRNLGVDPGERRLAELGPPQKTMQINRWGRTLRITTRLLIQGSCGISRPLAEPRVLERYLRDGRHGKLRGRLEADAKALFALYEYGRLHGWVRVRWGFLDERIAAPWVHRDEPTLFDLRKRAARLGTPLELVVGRAPGWTDPWSRAIRAHARLEEEGWRSWLVDEEGYPIDERDVQSARLAGAPGSPS